MESVNSSGSQLDIIGRKLDLYTNYMHFESSGIFILALFKFILFFVLLFTASSIVGRLVHASAGQPFVILNATTKIKYDQYKKKSELIVVAIIIGFIINVLAGIFLNNIVPVTLNLLNWLYERPF
jgi:hypothetical protein